MDNFEKLFGEKRKKSLELGSKTDFKPNFDSLQCEYVQLMKQGVVYYENDTYSQAKAYLDKAITLNPTHSHLLKVRANIKEDSGDPIGAINDYKESLSYGGSNWYSTYNQIAVNFLSLKNYSKALEAFNIAVELKENLEEEGTNEKVLPPFMDGVVIIVDMERILVNRANTKLSLKDFDGCVSECERAMKINSSYSNTYFIAGLMFAQINDTEKSYNFLKVAESLGHNQSLSYSTAAIWINTLKLKI